MLFTKKAVKTVFYDNTFRVNGTQTSLDLVASFGKEDHGIQKVLEGDPTVLLTVHNLEHLPKH